MLRMQMGRKQTPALVGVHCDGETGRREQVQCVSSGDQWCQCQEEGNTAKKGAGLLQVG